MIYTHVAAAILAAAIAATGAWKVQDWRYNAKEKERAEQQLESERNASKTAIRRHEAVIEAQNAAANRERDLRGAAAGARAALVGLSSSADQALRDAATSHAACTDASSKLKVVFLECSRNYEEVARDADLWESNAITLSDAWPR